MWSRKRRRKRFRQMIRPWNLLRSGRRHPGVIEQLEAVKPMGSPLPLNLEELFKMIYAIKKARECEQPEQKRVSVKT